MFIVIWEKNTQSHSAAAAAVDQASGGLLAFIVGVRKQSEVLKQRPFSLLMAE